MLNWKSCAGSVIIVLALHLVGLAQAPPVNLTCRPSGPDVVLEWINPFGTVPGDLIEVHSDESGGANPVATLLSPASVATIPLPAPLGPTIQYSVIIHSSSGPSPAAVCTLDTAPPAHDFCSAAQFIGTGAVSVPWSNFFSTDGGVPIVPPASAMCSTWSNQEFQNDVWFQYTAAFTDTAITLCAGLSLPGSSTTLAVYTGCPGDPAQLVGCDGGSCGAGLAAVDVSLVPGTSYWIRIGSTTLIGDGELTIVENDFPPGSFQRDDCNHDGATNVADAVFLLIWLYPAFPPPLYNSCPDACDSNDDGGLNIADAVHMLTRLFSLGAPIPALPPATCADGGDPTPDTLQCIGYVSC